MPLNKDTKLLNKETETVAQSVRAVEYTDCISAKG